jgi:hypothetical protein
VKERDIILATYCTLTFLELSGLLAAEAAVALTLTAEVVLAFYHI